MHRAGPADVPHLNLSQTCTAWARRLSAVAALLGFRARAGLPAAKRRARASQPLPDPSGAEPATPRPGPTPSPLLWPLLRPAAGPATPAPPGCAASPLARPWLGPGSAAAPAPPALLAGVSLLLRGAASALARAEGAPLLGDGPWLRWYSACSATAHHVNESCKPLFLCLI